MPILQAIVDGKTIQHKTINREWYDTNVASLDYLVTYYEDYRIKPETTYRPFKDAEECWAEMLEHQPFGWVKAKDKGIRLCMSGLNQKSAFTQVGHEYDEAFDEFIFADGFPFGVKVEE